MNTIKKYLIGPLMFLIVSLLIAGLIVFCFVGSTVTGRHECYACGIYSEGTIFYLFNSPVLKRLSKPASSVHSRLYEQSGCPKCSHTKWLLATGNSKGYLGDYDSMRYPFEAQNINDDSKEYKEILEVLRKIEADSERIKALQIIRSAGIEEAKQYADISPS